jgi:hypothetical protein
MIEIVSKAEFAAIAGVSRPTVSQRLREGSVVAPWPSAFHTAVIRLQKCCCVIGGGERG